MEENVFCETPKFKLHGHDGVLVKSCDALQH